MTTDAVVQRFRAAWYSLAPERQETVTLRCQGYTNEAISARHGVPLYTVQNQLWAARQHLSDALQAEPGVAPVVTTAMVCRRLGYEQALADVERLIARKHGGQR